MGVRAAEPASSMKNERGTTIADSFKRGVGVLAASGRTKRLAIIDSASFTSAARMADPALN